MAKQSQQTASVGVVEHGNSAFLVTVTSDGELLDRRRIDLTSGDLPTLPHHHEGSWAVGRYIDSPWAKKTTLPEAIELVERVRLAASDGARESLDALTKALPVTISSIALRICPELPPTVEACIRDNRAQTYADTVMYRKALAHAAMDRDWTVHWYDRDRVLQEAEAALGCDDINGFLKELGKSVGPPWQAKHKLAAAAALSVTTQASAS